MNELMTFVNEEFGTVRSTVINGEPWLLGKDIFKKLQAFKLIIVFAHNCAP